MFNRQTESPTGHYEAEVNKGSINMGRFTTTLNRRWEDGWSLAHVFEQDGNTVMVWERRTATVAG